MPEQRTAKEQKKHDEFKKKFNPPLEAFDNELSKEEIEGRDLKEIGKELLLNEKFAKLFDDKDFKKEVYKYGDKNHLKFKEILEGKDGFTDKEMRKLASFRKKEVLAGAFKGVYENRKLLEQSIKLDKAAAAKVRGR